MTACSLFEERADDFAWCEDVIRRNSHSFYRAFSLLPACKRQSVYALYAFCRLADDCVDRDASAAKLEQVQDDLARFFAGTVVDAPLWRALDAVCSSFDLDAQPFFDMLEGQRRDLGRVPNRGVSGPSPENRRHPCEVNLSLRPPSGQWRSL